MFEHQQILELAAAELIKYAPEGNWSVSGTPVLIVKFDKQNQPYRIVAQVSIVRHPVGWTVHPKSKPI